MGTADVVPGISGGTVAFRTGIYEELVKTIAGLNPANLIKIFKESDRGNIINNYWTSLNISFILFILAGIVPAIFLAALWIPYTVDQFPHFFLAFCLGCIVFTLVRPFQEQDWKPVTFTFLLLGILSMAVLLLSPKNEINLKLTDSESNLVYEGKFQNSSRLKLSLSNTILKDQYLNLSVNETSFVINMKTFNENKDIKLPSNLVVQKKKQKMIIYQEATVEPGALELFFSGAIAICAMILPGISGAFILILLDMYIPVLLALKKLDIAMLGPFILGCLVGIISVARLLQKIFNSYKQYLIPLLLGVILGSFFKLWPWNYGKYNTTESMQIIAIFFFSLVSCALIEKAIKKESA